MFATVILAASLLAPPNRPQGTEIERVVAVVDKEVITQTELLTETRVALAWRQGEHAASADLNEELFQVFRDYVVDQTLVAIQVRRLGSVEVSDEEIDQRAWQFSQHFSSMSAYHAFLRRFGISESTVRDILARDLRNDRYITQRMRTRVVSGRGSTSTPENYAETLRGWIRELRQGAELRLLGPDGDLELQGRTF